MRRLPLHRMGLLRNGTGAGVRGWGRGIPSDRLARGMRHLIFPPFPVLFASPRPQFKLQTRRPPVYDLSSFRATDPAAQSTSRLVSAVILAQVTLSPPRSASRTHFCSDQERRHETPATEASLSFRVHWCQAPTVSANLSTHRYPHPSPAPRPLPPERAPKPNITLHHVHQAAFPRST